MTKRTVTTRYGMLPLASTSSGTWFVNRDWQTHVMFLRVRCGTNTYWTVPNGEDSAQTLDAAVAKYHRNLAGALSRMFHH